MDLQTVIIKSNREIYDLEREAIELDERLNRYRHLKSAAWILASMATAFASKLVEIPYKLSRMSENCRNRLFCRCFTFGLQIFTGVMLKDTKMPTVYVNPNC